MDYNRYSDDELISACRSVGESFVSLVYMLCTYLSQKAAIFASEFTPTYESPAGIRPTKRHLMVAKLEKLAANSDGAGSSVMVAEPLDVTFARWVRRFPWLHERILCSQVIQIDEIEPNPNPNPNWILCSQVIQIDEIEALLQTDETAPKGWKKKDLVRVLEAQGVAYQKHERQSKTPRKIKIR